MNCTRKLATFLNSKAFLWSLSGFILLFVLCLFFSGKSIVFSIGGDSFGSFSSFEHMRKNVDSSSLYGQPFTLNDYIIPNPIFDFINRIFFFISPTQSYFFNLHIFFGVLSAFFISFIIGFKILKEVEHKSIFVIFFAITVSFSSFNLIHYFTGHLSFLVVFLLLWFYAFYIFYEHQNIKTALLLGVISGISTVHNAYYGYFSMLFSIYVLCYVLIFESQKFKRFFLYFIACGGIALIIVIAFIYPELGQLLKPNEQLEGSGFNRPFASVWGVLPWMYLLPSPQHFLASEQYGTFYRKVMLIGNVPENSVYLGWFNIIFFCYGAYLFFKKRLSITLRQWYRFAFGAAFFCFLISLPPFIPLGGERKIYWISTFLHKVFPMFRVFSRLGFFVLIFVAIGALIGFYCFLKKHEKQNKIIITVAMVFLIFELVPKIPLLELNSHPQVYDWLKEQPGDFIIYEIPEEKGKDDYVFYKYLHYQNIHGKKLFNRAPVTVDLQSKAFYEKLKKWNIKYIIQHQDFYEEGPIPYEHKPYILLPVAEEKFNDGKVEELPKWYKIEKKIGNAVVYKVYDT